MNPRLTLLLLCNQCEPYALFISALVSADFQVLIARDSTRARKFLQSLSIDAIMILPDGEDGEAAAGAELKRLAPRAPVLMLTKPGQQRQAGIDAMWHADLGDEVLASAAALFFRQWLAPSRLAPRAGGWSSHLSDLPALGPSPAA
jgi:hypothetical protein